MANDVIAVESRTLPRPKSWRIVAVALWIFVTLHVGRAWVDMQPAKEAAAWHQYAIAALTHMLFPERHLFAVRYAFFHNEVFHESFWRWICIPFVAAVLLLLGLYLFAWWIDFGPLFALRVGKQVAGPVLHKSVKKFQKAIKGDGVSIAFAYPSLLERGMKWKPRGHLYIPLAAQHEHFVVSGSPGSGKTQTIQHIVDSLKARAKRDGKRVVFVFFDPHGTYIQRYWKPGAWIGNPYDKRSFSWCPTWELDLERKAWSKARALGMAESFYVGQQSKTEGDNNMEFFNRTAQLMFQQLVADHQPEESQEYAFWMENPDEEIATRVTGKVKKDVDPGSLPQANGIYSQHSMPQQAFEAIPLSGWHENGKWKENVPRWTSREWTATRNADIFLTSTADTQPILRILHSAWVDMMIRDLLAMGDRPDLPEVVFVLDELAAAQRLPLLAKGANELRKFRGTFILGFQSRSALDGIYGKDVTTSILSACKTQIYHRTGEHEAAKWQSENVGEIEFEELQESWGWSFFSFGVPRNVTVQLKRKLLVMPSIFLGLRDRVSVLKFENQLVKYRVALSRPYRAAVPFIPRPDAPLVKGVKRPPEPPPEPRAKKPKPKPNGTQVVIGFVPGTQGGKT